MGTGWFLSDNSILRRNNGYIAFENASFTTPPDVYLYRNPLYSNFLYPFWDAVKFPCDIMNNDKE